MGKQDFIDLLFYMNNVETYITDDHHVEMMFDWENDLTAERVSNLIQLLEAEVAK